MKVAQVAKPNAPLETVARASDVVAVLGNSGLGHLAAATGAGASPETIELNPLHILGARARGLALRHVGGFEDTLGFRALTGVEAMIETYPLAYGELRKNDERQGPFPRGSGSVATRRERRAALRAIWVWRRISAPPRRTPA